MPKPVTMILLLRVTVTGEHKHCLRHIRGKLCNAEPVINPVRTDKKPCCGARGRTRTGTVVYYRGILSPLRLPDSATRAGKMEAEAGIEPASKALQASA